MKKIYTTCLLLTGFVLSAAAQDLPQLPQLRMTKQNGKAILSKKDTELRSTLSTSNAVSRGGGSCQVDEDFEGATFPATWSTDVTNVGNTWGHATGGGNPDGTMGIYWDETNGAQDESFVTPSMDLTQLSSPILSFDWQMSYYWGVSPNDAYDFTVLISTDGGTNYTTLWTETDEGVFAGTTWYSKIIDLGAYASATNAKIAFNYNGAGGDFIKVDNVSVCSQASNDLVVDKVILGDPINDFVYAQIPTTLTTAVVLGAIVRNVGGTTQTNVAVDFGIYSYNAAGIVNTTTVAGPSTLAPGVSDTVWYFSSYNPSLVDTLEAVAEVNAIELEANPADNINFGGPALITTDTWSHDNIYEGYYALGYAAASAPVANQAFELGSQYYCQTAGSTMYAAEFALGSNTTAQSVYVNVYENGVLVSQTLYDLQPGDLSVSSIVWLQIPLDDVVPLLADNVYRVMIGFEGGDSGYVLGNNFGNNDGSQLVYFESDQTLYGWPSVLSATRVLVTYSVDAPEEAALSSVNIYPNPAIDQVRIDLTSVSNQTVIVNLISASGALVASEQLGAKVGQASSVNLNVAGLAAGIYTVQVITEKSTLTNLISVQ